MMWPFKRKPAQPDPREQAEAEWLTAMAALNGAKARCDTRDQHLAQVQVNAAMTRRLLAEMRQ
jgi:hypothetical protein